jgi:aspartyl-tRNA(Asn)/glutamyl-tRNA(Gln) amidotransferase subunit A
MTKDGIDRRRLLAGAAVATVGGTLAGTFVSGSGAEAALGWAARRAADRTNPADLDVAEAVALLRARKLSSRELTVACLDRIKERDGDITAWERVYAEEALAAADKADQKLSRPGSPPLLCGIPIGFKDIIAVGGRPLTAGSRALEGNVAPSDSHAWERAREQGMVLLGHAKTQEFATGNAPQTAGNPYDPARSPGGSSNGPGAAVGGCTVPVALGTDSGGSLRRPASACGINTIMGTYGRVSTRGIVTGNRASDHVGPLVRSATDVSLMLSVLAGRDPLDPTTYAAPEPPRRYPLEPRGGSKPLRGLRLALTPNLPPFDTLAPGVKAIFERFVGEVRTLGAEIVEVTLPAQPSTPGPNPESVLLHRDLFAEKGQLYTLANRTSVADNLQNANKVTALALYEAQVAKGQWLAALNALFADNRLDAIVQPCQVLETPLRGSGGPDESGDVGRFGSGTVRSIWNGAGFPAMSIPGGLSADTGMPVGIQIVGAPWTEAKMLQIAIDYQAHTDYHEIRPRRWQP